ncbi:MAG: MBL fold metallo-hydrolase [Spirochaetes bacterium]|nr:MBL fold metallo-hydrolase [Spirochaetota bacterium]
MNYELYSHGGAQEVTGSKHFLQANGSLIMVDCGAFQGHREEAEKKNRNWDFDAKKVSSMVLTHAHYDHSGLLPLLPMKGFNGNVYATPATRDLANLIMMDSAHIQAKDIEYLKKKAQKRGETFEKEPLYSERDVLACLERFVTVSYHRPFHLSDGISARFYDAGHILGSAVTVLDIKKNGGNLSVGFSGDLGRKNLPILRDPERIPPVDYLVMESTYGNRLHDPIENAKEKLADVINRTVHRGGKVVVPAFAVERTQELVYFLHLLNDEGKIPKVPIFVDSPMATNATSIFRVHQECYDEQTRRAFIDHHNNPFGFNELTYVVNTEASKKLNTLNGPAVVISASGMCESGRILHHLENNIEDPRATILIVGFMAENTLGRRIVERQKEVKIFGKTCALKAEVAVLNSFSAHADYNDITEYVGTLDKKRLKGIFLVHGEPEAQSSLKDRLCGQGYPVKIVEYGSRYSLKG